MAGVLSGEPAAALAARQLPPGVDSQPQRLRQADGRTRQLGPTQQQKRHRPQPQLQLQLQKRKQVQDESAVQSAVQ
eukprot:CAMPEP_0116966316 /NCGR_PEP_ID=MMETSP0467-20121206/49778_1 /TAXON_ID=283647 /ORGANISM="Mesodinium pulex, Strain SPMC105" /LENGTH=75 /DNA_ID=CAMNT_0004655801 /DNA_START=460 /DNA_END=687 /DNA_ORIENTATION=+